MATEYSVEKMIEQKVNDFQMSMLQRLLAPQLRWIEWLGAIAGFLIGLIQIAIFFILSGS